MRRLAALALALLLAGCHPAAQPQGAGQFTDSDSDITHRNMQ
jgi:hypothetical protein